MTTLAEPAARAAARLYTLEDFDVAAATAEILDLYAGPGGWDEGLRLLGITQGLLGIEYEPNACATAVANGHARLLADVSKVVTSLFRKVRVLIASPPCQAWSRAGNRLGEEDRARVHALIDRYAAGSDEIGEGWADERSHHAAQPVRWVRDLRPETVLLEQVPAVLGLWEHMAEVFRAWGYSVWTGVLSSADYGVPQIRERAILIASRVRKVAPPAPTHAREPQGSDLFGGELLPWVTMADALGWGMTDRPAFTVPTAGGKRGGADEQVGGSQARRRLYLERAEGRWIGPTEGLVRPTVQEVATLQSFPADYVWTGVKTTQYGQIGNAVPPKLAAAVAAAAL